MPIGQSLAQTFRFQPRQQAIGPRDIINRGLQAEQELYGGPQPMTPELPEGMAQIEGVTSDIMNQWIEAKNFADTMWHNYRINVTRPDVRNPLSVQANQAYMKAIAGIQYAGQRLKDYNTQITEGQKQVFEGTGEFVQDPRTQMFDNPEEWFASTRIDPRAMQSNQYLATDKQTPGAFKAAQGDINKLRGQVQSDEDAAVSAGLPGKARRQDIVNEQILNSRYEQPYQLDPDYATRKKGEQDEMSVFEEVENLRKGLFNQDGNAVDRLKGIIFDASGQKGVDVRSVMKGGVPGIAIFREDAKGNTFKEEIMFDPNDSQYAGFSRLNDYLQKLNPSKYKVPTSRMIEYLEKAKENGYKVMDLPQPNTTQEFDKNLVLAYSLYEMGDTKAQKGGKAGKISKVEKQAFIDMLDDLALQNVLIKGNGARITDVEWDDGKLIIYSEDKVDEDGEPIAQEIDPKSKADQSKIKDLLEMNYQYIIENPNQAGYGSAPKIGTMDKVGNLDLQGQDPKAILKAFEEHRKSKQ